MAFSCDEIDRSIAVCREWEAAAVTRARAVAASPPPPRCDGLLMAVRAGNSVELRAIGEDGAEWGKVTASPGFPLRPLAFVLVPLTAPADFVVMTYEGLLYGTLALLLALH